MDDAPNVGPEHPSNRVGRDLPDIGEIEAGGRWFATLEGRGDVDKNRSKPAFVGGLQL
jgi:hypothetical protein